MDKYSRKCLQSGAVLPPRETSGTLAEQVYRRLSASILADEQALGEKISEPALARKYGVSRGPLREALHRLQERKLITRSANQSPRVIQPTPEALVELFLVREALEGMAARLAAMHATEAEIAALRATVTEHPAAGEGASAELSAEQHDQDFHATVARCSRNPMLTDLLCGEIYALLRLYRGMTPRIRPRGRRAIVEHQRTLAAIEDRDADVAELLMRRHVASARARREAALAEARAPEPIRRARTAASKEKRP